MKFSSVWHLTQKFLWRYLRKGELTLLLLSLVVATATITSVTVFTSRISNSITDEAANYLGADAKITGSMAIPDEWQEEVDSFPVATAHLMYFRAMAFAATELTLVQVKAVSEAYPLKGNVEVGLSLDGGSINYRHGPSIGSVWLASRLFKALNIDIGDTLKIGDKELVVAGVIRKEPDSVQTAFGFSPRVIMHIDDVAATNAVQVGSRINYEWLLAGDKRDIVLLEANFKDKLGEHYKWRDSKNGNQQVNKTMQRADSFLLLGSSLSLLLAGVAIALAVRRFIQRQTSTVAILKTLGVAPNTIAAMYFMLVSSLGILAVCVGCFIGWLLHLAILSLLGDFIATDLAGADVSAYVIAALSVFTTLLAFCFIPLRELQKTQPSVILRDVTTRNISVIGSSLFGFLAIFIILVLFSGDILITLGLAFGIAVLAALVFLVSRILILLLSRGLRFKSQWWRIGIVNIHRHQPMTSLQILIFATVLMLVAVLTEVRTGLMQRWQNQIPVDAPNHFAFNIFTADLENIKQVFADNDIQASAYYPMSRGRIYSINDELLDERVAKSKSQINYERELNLTWARDLGTDNKIVDGQWWQSEAVQDMSASDKPMAISIEQEYAKGLNLQLGDRLVFSVAGQKFTSVLTSIRTVEWDSMNPNFFVIFDRPFGPENSSNWVTSFYVDPGLSANFVSEFLKKYPSVSILELEQTLKQIQDIVTKVSSAVEFILWLVLVSGLLILLISVQATLDSRKHESAIYRALGAQRKLVRNTLIVEFSVIGFLSGLIAAIGAEIILYVLQVRVFDLSFMVHGYVWAITPLAGALLIGASGYLSTREVINTSPLAVIRAS